MTLTRRRAIAWAVLVAFTLAGAVWLGRLDLREKISTNVLDLVPLSDAAPELNVVRSLANEAEARTMLFSLQRTGAPLDPGEAALFAAELKRSPAFADALPLQDSRARDALGKVVFDRRLTLLFPLWLAERQHEYAALASPRPEFSAWLAEDAARRLNAFIATPAALAFQDVIPADPLLLVPGVVDRLKPALTTFGGAVSHDRGLVWAKLDSSPLAEAGQDPAFRAIDAATQAIAARYAGTTVQYTGVNRFAAASRSRIEREVSRLNVWSLVAVFTVALVFVRAVHRAVHLVPVVLLSILGAWVSVTIAFAHVHVLVFVVGSLLTGVAIDYGFYLFMQPPLSADESYEAKVRRLAKPLLASCFTTVAGFALLLWSNLPVIRQLGVFVGCGLLSALFVAVVYFATVRNPFLPPRTFGRARLPGPTRHWLRRGLVVGWVVALLGMARLTWRDDIRDLEIPSPALKQTDAAVRAAFGESNNRSVYLTFGDTLAQARDRLEQFTAWLRERGAAGFSLAAVVPTTSAHAAAVQFARENPQFVDRLTAALGSAGFDASAFEPFFAAYREFANQESAAAWTAAVNEVLSRLPGPMSLLAHGEGRLQWWVTIADRAALENPPPRLDTVARNQLETLNGVFAQYRASALRLSAVGLAIVGLGVLLTYGVRDGVRIFAIPAGACLGVFGVFGWAGMPLNLFHLLGAFLGVCLTHNYSIFTATSAYRREPPPVSVRLSALTAASSFAVLATSSIPVVRALGLTVAAIVVAALVSIELEHLRPLAGRES